MRRTLRTAGNWIAWTIAAVDVALILTLVIQARDVQIVNNAIDIWFDRSDPAVETQALERRLFGSDTWMLATVWLKGDRVEHAGDVARELTGDLERIAGVTRVISPTSIDVLQRDDQGLFFDRLDPNSSWNELREKLVNHPIAGNFLVHTGSPETFSFLVKENTGPSTGSTDRQRLVSEVRRTLDGHSAIAASAVSGTAVINADLNRLSWGDFLVLIPATVVVASLVLLLILRFQWRTTAAVLTSVGLQTLALIAAMLLSGRPFTMVTLALPGLTFTLGIASSLHVTNWIRGWLRDGRGTTSKAARATLRELANPIVVSHVTTAMGFGLLAVVQVTPVQEMALFGALGELYSGVHVLFVLPRCLRWLGAMSELTRNESLFAGHRLAARCFDRLAGLMVRLQRVRTRVLAATAVVCVAIASLLSMVHYDSTYLDMIHPGERLRQDYARFEAAGLPSAQLSVVIRRSDTSSPIDARLNDAIRVATAEISALPEVSKVIGPAEIFAEVAPMLADGEPLDRFAADDASVADAYVFALSGGNTEIASYVHDGLDAYRLMVFFPYLDNSKLERLAHGEIGSILTRHFATFSDVSAEISGVTVLWANMDNAISRGQVASILIMALACFVTFFISLRDWTLAASAMFVNMLPVAAIGALLGAVGWPIDMATVFIMGISLGIAVDDTSFFAHEYRNATFAVPRSGFLVPGSVPGSPRSEHPEQNLDPGTGTMELDDALAVTLRHTGPTMVGTCVVIVIGFSALLLSSFTPMRTFGGMTALGLVAAMLCDIFVFPFLLLAFPGKAKEFRHAEVVADRADAAVPAAGSAGSY
jgi:predicted RND superfamily exporter protein